ncbi:hypothetical protein F5141DRAFT_1131349 [Pisolithus sp. B1]|nr:hypothetical protein F5141DRAFT_1131349 [Pisolithus sp. B1]
MQAALRTIKLLSSSPKTTGKSISHTTTHPSRPKNKRPPHLTPKVQEFPPNLPDTIRQLRAPQGRRRRGGTYAGEGIDKDAVGGIWNWVVIAQVKEGTENRGSIAAVVRAVRKTLLTMDTPIRLPPSSKRRAHNGWAIVDAGEFCHSRQKYFEHLNH